MKRKIIGLAAVTAITVAAAITAPGRAVATAAPPIEICTAEGSHSLCLNRNGGGTTAGTSVIGWSEGDSNNYFDYVWLNGACNHGYVSAVLECPFTPNRGLNARYDGAAIVEIHALGNVGLCVADSGTGSGAAVLGTCPDFDGNGGSNGTIFILSDVHSFTSPQPTSYVVNRYWSDFSGQSGGAGSNPRWLCRVVRGSPLFENFSVGMAGACQFNRLFH
jgi:hypothetical protein